MKFKLLERITYKNRLLICIAAGGMATTGTLMATAPRHDINQIAEKAWPVSARLIEVHQLTPELKVFGRVETANHARLTAAVTANVQTVNVTEGEQVEQGQVLLSLNDADEQLRLQQRLAESEQAAADLTSTRRELLNDREILKHLRELRALSRAKSERLATLQAQNLVAVERLEDTRQQVARQAIQFAQQQLKVDNHPQRLANAEARLSRAQALLQEQELRLARTLVVAPFRGRISRLAVAPGERIMEGQELISLYDTQALRVRAAIPGRQVDIIRQAVLAGTAIQAQVNTAAGELVLVLDQLAGEVKPGRAGIDGLFRISSPAPSVELGRAVDMTIFLPALEQVAAVPVHSVYGDDHIYGIVDQRLQAIPIVNMGQRVNAGGELEVLLRAPTLDPTTPVLMTTLPRASTGLRVQVVNG